MNESDSREDHFHSRLYPQFKYMTFIYSSPFKLNIGVYDFPHKLISLVNPYIYFTVLRDDCVVYNATTYPGR